MLDQQLNDPFNQIYQYKVAALKTAFGKNCHHFNTTTLIKLKNEVLEIYQFYFKLLLPYVLIKTRVFVMKRSEQKVLYF